MNDESALDVTLSALANPTRRAILARLRDGEATVNELAEPFDMSQPAISKHLKVLEEAGLVTRSRDAQRRPCRLRAAPMAALGEWVGGFLGSSVDRFPRVDRLMDRLGSLDRKLGAPRA